MLEVDADHAHRGDTSGLEGWVNSREQYPHYVRLVQGSVMIVFPDFEDAEFIFGVPEVQFFLRRAHDRIRHLFYYLLPHVNMGALLGFAVAHTENEEILTTGGQPGVNIMDPTVLSVLVDRLAATARFADRMADDTEQIIWRILEPIGSAEIDQDALNFLGAGINAGLEPRMELRRALLATVIHRARAR
jgi:hypothetical protein